MGRNERIIAFKKDKLELQKEKEEARANAKRLEDDIKSSKMTSNDKNKQSKEIELTAAIRRIDKALDKERRFSYYELKLDKLYLAEIIEDEKPEFGSNNLILAPVGSGKSTFIKSSLRDFKKGTVLHLVSNDTLKESISPNNNLNRSKNPNNTFTTQNKTVFGKEDYEIYVMSYAEFGKRINKDDEFVKDIERLYCDEIHSLPEYRDYTKDINLSHAIKYLFQKHENKQIFYFTATNHNLIELERKEKGQLKHIKTYDYTNHKKILKYEDRATYKINHIKQLEPHLRSRASSFEYYGYKGLAYAKTIQQEKAIEEILIAEGYNPLVLWSTNNEDYPLNEKQLKARDILINEERIPEPYNFLVINSALREGWNLRDEMVQLVIMNTTNETDQIQARGRIRHDIDVLIYRTNDLEIPKLDLIIPEKYMNIPLTKVDKDKLVAELNLSNRKGELVKWRGVKDMAIKSGYTVGSGSIYIDSKRIRADTISVSL